MATFNVNDTLRRKQYTGNGSAGPFAFSFQINATSDIEVLVDSTAKTISTHYTVSISSDGTGSVSFTSGNYPTSSQKITLIGKLPYSRTSVYTTGGALTAASLESDLDTIAMKHQQLDEKAKRGIKLAKSTQRDLATTGELDFPYESTVANNANKVIAYNNAGTGLELKDSVPVGGDSTKLTLDLASSTDSDPGSAKIRFNNTTIGSSQTIAYIDDADAFSNNIESYVQSWDDVTANSNSRGRIRMIKANNIGVYAVYRISNSITNASGYSKVPLTFIASGGSFSDGDEVFVSFVAHGEDGTSQGLDYTFSSTTTDSDPGSGTVRINNSTYSSANKIIIDDADANGVDVSADILTWDDSTSSIKGYVTIKDKDTQSSYARFSITSSTTDNSGYSVLNCTHIDSNGTITNGGPIAVHFTRTGDKGDAGTAASIAVNTVTANTVSAGGTPTAAVANAGSSSAANFNFTFGLVTGNTGATGASGTNSGLSMTWNSSTSDADPGNGKLAMNNGTLGSVSVLYVDSQDDAGANIESFVRSWDDAVNSTARGIVTITKEGTPSTFWIGKISSGVTNATGYTKVNVTHIVSNGSFTNNDGIGVHFSYSGADGADGSGSMSSFTLTADSGSNQTISDSNTLDIEGGEGIDTVVGATDKVTISGEDASTSNKGIASFHSDNFSVSSGAVTIKDQGVALAEIVNVSATDKILGRSSSGAGTIEEIDCTAAGRALLDDANASAQRTTLGLAIGSDIQSFNSDTVFKDVQNTFTKAQLASTQTANATGSTTLDFDTYQNFILTFTGNVTLAAPSTEASQIGQTGVIIIKQDGTGSRTLSLHGDYETPSAGGVGTISTAANAVDIIPYCVLENDRIMLGSVQIAFG